MPLFGEDPQKTFIFILIALLIVYYLFEREKPKVIKPPIVPPPLPPEKPKVLKPAAPPVSKPPHKPLVLTPDEHTYLTVKKYHAKYPSLTPVYYPGTFPPVPDPYWETPETTPYCPDLDPEFVTYMGPYFMTSPWNCKRYLSALACNDSKNAQILDAVIESNIAGPHQPLDEYDITYLGGC